LKKIFEFLDRLDRVSSEVTPFVNLTHSQSNYPLTLEDKKTYLNDP